MLTQIVVPLDGSTFAEFALPPAVEIARRARSQLELMMALDMPVDLSGVVLDTGSAEGRASAYLSGKAKEISEATERPWDGEIRLSVRTGGAARSLEDRAREIPADLVVMSSHGRGRLSRVWLGSVTDAFIRHAPCPVLVVRPEEDEEPDPTGPFDLERILVPVDRTEMSTDILDRVVELGQLFEARFHLLTVIRPPRLPSDGVHPYLAHASDLDREWLQEERVDAETRLEGLAERLAQRDLAVEVSVVEDSDIASSILRMADEEGADLIAMTTQARRGVSRILLGSVADKVVRGSSLPVFLSRPTPE